LAVGSATTKVKHCIGILACVALLAARPALPAPSYPPQGQRTYDDFLRAMADRLARLDELRSRLDDMNVADWLRDPGFYVDQLRRFAFTALPASGAEHDRLQQEPAAVPAIVAAARRATTGTRSTRS
jgi:hypothetical protein